MKVELLSNSNYKSINCQGRFVKNAALREFVSGLTQTEKDAFQLTLIEYANMQE